MKGENPYISAAAAAEKLGVGLSRIKVLAAEGRIPGAFKAGREWLIPAEPQVTAAERQRPGKVEFVQPKRRRRAKAA